MEKERRKTILLMSDDMRFPSGIGVMSREIILQTAHHYNWIQVGGGMNHPDKGKVMDMSEEVNKLTGLTDSSVILYPFDGYGEQNLLRWLMVQHKIDVILHFTDPRFWQWLYRMANEVRQKVPIAYYTIWDDLPYPTYNRPFYESCDLLNCISKQTENIVKNVLQNKEKPDWAIRYVPHGINEDIFKPLDLSDEKLVDFKKKMLGGKESNFILLYNNRNIRRKMTSDIIIAFKKFLDTLSKEDRKKVFFVLHTQPVDDNGTDLGAVIEALARDVREQIVVFGQPLSPEEMNLLYNMADCTINVASNEGWGLSSTESMMAGKMIINNVTGGLQDQMRFVDDENQWIKFTTDFPTNHTGRYKKCGEWAIPIFPSNISCQGSPVTPFIYDDRCAIPDIQNAIRRVYELSPEERKRRGLLGRDWVTSDESMMSARWMGKNFIDSLDTLMKEWKPIDRFIMYNVSEEIENFKLKHSGDIVC